MWSVYPLFLASFYDSELFSFKQRCKERKYAFSLFLWLRLTPYRAEPIFRLVKSEDDIGFFFYFRNSNELQFFVIPDILDWNPAFLLVIPVSDVVQRFLFDIQICRYVILPVGTFHQDIRFDEFVCHVVVIQYRFLPCFVYFLVLFFVQGKYPDWIFLHILQGHIFHGFGLPISHFNGINIVIAYSL